MARRGKAIELDGGLVQSYTGLGEVYQESGDADKAAQAYVKAAELSDPQNKVLIYVKLGRLYTELREYQLALDYADKTLELLPAGSGMWEYISERKVLLRKALEAAQEGPGSK